MGASRGCVRVSSRLIQPVLHVSQICLAMLATPTETHRRSGPPSEPLRATCVIRPPWSPGRTSVIHAGIACSLESFSVVPQNEQCLVIAEDIMPKRLPERCPRFPLRSRHVTGCVPHDAEARS